MIHDMQVPDDHRNMQARVKLISLPFKRLGLHTAAASTIIARSDSNGEDLEAFAGAGTSPSHDLHLQHRMVNLHICLCVSYGMTTDFPMLQ